MDEKSYADQDQLQIDLKSKFETAKQFISNFFFAATVLLPSGFSPNNFLQQGKRKIILHSSTNADRPETQIHNRQMIRIKTLSTSMVSFPSALFSVIFCSWADKKSYANQKQMQIDLKPEFATGT